MAIRNYNEHDRAALLFDSDRPAAIAGHAGPGRGQPARHHRHDWHDWHRPGIPRQGGSRSILRAGMPCLRTWDIAGIGLEVDGSNTPAVGLYTSTGFVKAAERYWFESSFTRALNPER